MSKFNGSNDPEEYLSWALKVDKIFRLHNYEEEKKIAMASCYLLSTALVFPQPQHNEEQRYGKQKFSMPKSNGSNNPEEYLSWALKVDKIFRLHNYEEEKKIVMASLEFQDYVLIWWEQVIERR